MGNVKGAVRGPYQTGRGFSFTGDGYRLLHNLHNHPLASVVGQVLEHRKVLYDKIGNGVHPCHWCDKLLTWGGITGIVVDHLDEVVLNNSPENLVASCVGCNTTRVSTSTVD